jgi:hypothetical protein
MYKHERVAAIREIRGKIWSPGRPSTVRRVRQVGFWRRSLAGEQRGRSRRGGHVIRVRDRSPGRPCGLRSDPGHQGVGPIMAAIFVAEIGDVPRFPTARHLCS